MKNVVMTLLLFLIVVYPLLYIADKKNLLTNILAEKRKGELVSSLCQLYLSQIILIVFTCVILKKSYLMIASSLPHCLGDTAAALFGIRYGRHKMKWKLADQHKTIEGSLAMAVVSFLSCLLVLTCLSDYHIGIIIFMSLMIGIVSAISELCSKDGYDTFIVPLSNALVLALLTYLF